MAYNFTAEKLGNLDIEPLNDKLTRFNLIEFFPIEVNSEHVDLGISIPFKHMDDHRFSQELTELMTFLICAEGFQVWDLFTGNEIQSGDITGMAEKISA